MKGQRSLVELIRDLYIDLSDYWITLGQDSLDADVLVLWCLKLSASIRSGRVQAVNANLVMLDESVSVL